MLFYKKINKIVLGAAQEWKVSRNEKFYSSSPPHFLLNIQIW